MELAILSRHGESEYSARGLMNGDTSVRVPLSERGIREAEAMGGALAQEQIDLCVTSEFQRARETADIALGGRDVPRIVMPELNDPLYGRFEGADIDAFREWATSAPSTERAEPGGESRLEIVDRYAAGYRKVLDRPERTILVVCHSLPVSYALGAREGKSPSARVPLADHATPYPFTYEELDRVVRLLQEWVASPTF